ncbi:hypothetical protein BMS3Abin17_00441 [archaeon BMS3Abin17]|nr:hypothetical protein BMS3Abin17_00441 [archaeon BMS3Abin17]HDZ60971.1 hypothetical protein [Candidatus Pacearchaeota archaeon]
MTKAYLLERSLSGVNIVSIYDEENLESDRTLTKFSGLINSLKLTTDEISEALCLEKNDVDSLFKKGYVTGDAVNNIRSYINAKNAMNKFKSRQFRDTRHQEFSHPNLI